MHLKVLNDFLKVTKYLCMYLSLDISQLLHYVWHPLLAPNIEITKRTFHGMYVPINEAQHVYSTQVPPAHTLIPTVEVVVMASINRQKAVYIWPVPRSQTSTIINTGRTY